MDARKMSVVGIVDALASWCLGAALFLLCFATMFVLFNSGLNLLFSLFVRSLISSEVSQALLLDHHQLSFLQLILLPRNIENLLCLMDC